MTARDGRDRLQVSAIATAGFAAGVFVRATGFQTAVGWAPLRRMTGTDESNALPTVGFMWVSGWYFFAVLLLLLCSGMAWCLNFLSLPGNWLMFGLAVLFAWWVSSDDGRGISGATVAILGALCLAGELIESLAGAAGAARLGGSRRGMILSVAGAVLGSVLGALVGVPIPIVGSALAAVVGGAIGAFLGALLGEQWKGRRMHEGLQIGRAAFLGRVWGTVGKLAVGAVMFVIIAADAIF